MDRQEADKIIDKIADERGRFYGDVQDGNIVTFINSLVSEDVRNHHQGICFRVNETDVSEDEEIDELLESIDARPKCMRCGYHQETDKEITKRMIEGYIVWDSHYGKSRDAGITVSEMGYLVHWLDKEE